MGTQFLKYFLVVVLSALFTALTLAGVVEGLLRHAVPTVEQVQGEYALKNPKSKPAETIESIQYRLSLYVFALESIWLLWLVPALGFVFFAALVGRIKRSDEKQLLEQLYFLEQNLERVTKFEREARQQLDAQQQHVFDAFEHSTDALLFVSADEAVEHLNPAAIQLLARWNRGQDQFTRRLLRDIIPGFKESELSRVLQQGLVRETPWSGEIQMQSLRVWLDIKILPGENGVYLVLRDTTHHHVGDAGVESTQTLLEQLSQVTPTAFVIMDDKFTYKYASVAWGKLFGFEIDTLIGRVHEHVMPQFPNNLLDIKKQVMTGQTIRKTDEKLMIGGHERWLSWSMQPWQNNFSKVGGYFMFVQDVTDQRQAQQRLQQLEEQENKLAYNDLLTGLPNRQLFYDRLNMGLATAYRQLNKVGLMFLDLDGFKAVNDTMGHDVGDMLLKAVADRLVDCVRQTDTVSRLGGDEFTVIASVKDEEDCALIADKIIKVINEPFSLGGHDDIKIGTSIGISMYPNDGGAANDLIRKSDIAMYVSKKGGKNQYHFYKPEMESLQEEQAAAEKAKEEAAANDA